MRTINFRPNQRLRIGTLRTAGRGRGMRPAPFITPQLARALLWLAAVALGLLPANRLLAWGRMGHRASAKLAESRLSPRARALVRELLEPGESLADASTWADENARQIPSSATWHYVNVPISHQHYDPSDCRGTGCVVSRIEDFRALLADRRRPLRERRTALRFLIHLVQDVHQPMHVADRQDRGGNALQLSMGRSETTNLHQLWDSGLLRVRHRHEDELARELRRLAEQPSARDWAGGSAAAWADESLEVGRQAYLDPATGRRLRSGDTISREYERVNIPRAEERLARAGVRLAHLLNQILGDQPPRGRDFLPGPR